MLAIIAPCHEILLWQCNFRMSWICPSVGRSVSWFVCHNFRKGQGVTLPCPYWSFCYWIKWYTWYNEISGCNSKRPYGIIIRNPIISFFSLFPLQNTPLLGIIWCVACLLTTAWNIFNSKNINICLINRFQISFVVLEWSMKYILRDFIFSFHHKILFLFIFMAIKYIYLVTEYISVTGNCICVSP